MGIPGESVRSAAQRAEFALDLIDMIHLASQHAPQPRSGGLVKIGFDDFVAFKRRGEEVAPETARRHWERWKRALRDLGFAAGADATDDTVSSQGAWPILVDIEAARRWGEDAIARAKGLAEAKAKLGPPSRTPKSVRPPERDMSAKAAFEVLGVNYTPTRLRAWSDRGAPFTRIKRGARFLYLTSVKELDDWIQRSVESGEINDPFMNRIPFEEARSRILAAIEKSGLSKLEFANRLDLNYGVLQSYVNPASKVRTVPLKTVLEAEVLGATSVGSDRSSKYSRVGAPTLSTIKEALKATGGRLSEASRLLTERGFTGVSPENIRYVAKKHGIPYATREIVVPDKPELLKALAKLDYNITRTAEHFGISATSVSRLIDKYGLREDVEPHLRAPTAEAVGKALDAASSTSSASAMLGISDSRFRFLVSQYGLSSKFAERSAQWRANERGPEKERLSTAIEAAIAAGETRNELAGRLGMKRTSVEAAVRRLGLRDRYNELRYEVGAKARGTGRELDPGSRVIPFWLAALRSLRAKLPTHGGNKILADRLGVAGGVVVGNWLSGKRVPRYDMIEKIVGMAGKDMPDWKSKLRRVLEEDGDYRTAAERIGIERNAFYSLLNGHVNPSEKMLEKLLGDEFWVRVRANRRSKT